jgi:hypothetical protein
MGIIKSHCIVDTGIIYAMDMGDVPILAIAILFTMIINLYTVSDLIHDIFPCDMVYNIVVYYEIFSFRDENAPNNTPPSPILSLPTWYPTTPDPSIN